MDHVKKSAIWRADPHSCSQNPSLFAQSRGFKDFSDGKGFCEKPGFSLELSLLPRMIEMLQILKFIYQQEWIHFCSDLVATEAELSVIEVDLEFVDALFAAGRTEELEELINSSWNSSPVASQ